MKILLIGAPLKTGNLGVSALGYSVISGLSKRIDNLELLLLDFGRGIRKEEIVIDGKILEYTVIGSTNSKNIFRSDSLYNLYFSVRMGIRSTPIIKLLNSIDYALDITGGDSFTDLYGLSRFNATYMRKKVLYLLKKPLILLPQTYGPYRFPETKEKAAYLIKQSMGVWTRDKQSIEVIKDLFPDSNIPAIKQGPDVAFTLTNYEPSNNEVKMKFNSYLDSTANMIRIGLNISGLLYNQQESCSNFGIHLNYQELVKEFIEKLMQEENTVVFLVPHVLGIGDFIYSDITACKNLYSDIKDTYNNRIFFLDENYDQCEVKWFIRQLDWFSGARMHSTIASLSSQVPTAVQAYSDKALGVFEVCNQSHNVVDLRNSGKETINQALFESYLNREKTKTELKGKIPMVIESAQKQFDEIANLMGK